MTYCLGIRVADGLVCLADGHITSGNQVSNAQKLSMHGSGPAQFAVMTSGLRSLRDKTLAYLERDMRKNHATEVRSEEHTSELQSLMRISYAVFCLKKKKTKQTQQVNETTHKSRHQ